MGSGELTATMVEVHKAMLARVPAPCKAVFLDTPAGFQLNVDEISRKAVEYFRAHVQKPLHVASYKSPEITTAFEAETAFHTLRTANFVLVGPGSPSYTVRQLKQTPIPEIFKNMIQSGGCLVAASAAALTMGRYTLPVYEIYKVGQKIHWIDGLDILSQFGFNLVVIPHWNNAEGGTHDTRFCFMGKTRLQRLEELLPDEVTLLGIDEHTACIIDLEAGQMEVQGIGNVTVRKKGREIKFNKEMPIPFDTLLLEMNQQRREPAQSQDDFKVPEPDTLEVNLTRKVDSIAAAFQLGIENHDSQEMAAALLELDSVIWQAQMDLADGGSISQAREILRDSIVLLGMELDVSRRHLEKYLTPLVEHMLQLRAQFRNEQKWSEADRIRDILQQSNIQVEDTPNGFRWRIDDDKND